MQSPSRNTALDTGSPDSLEHPARQNPFATSVRIVRPIMDLLFDGIGGCYRWCALGVNRFGLPDLAPSEDTAPLGGTACAKERSVASTIEPNTAEVLPLGSCSVLLRHATDGE